MNYFRVIFLHNAMIFRSFLLLSMLKMLGSIGKEVNPLSGQYLCVLAMEVRTQLIFAYIQKC